MHIKHIHCMIEKLAEYGKCMVEAGVGNGNVNLREAGQIVYMIKDLADAEYHSLISKAMKESEEEDEAEEKYIKRMLKEERSDEYKRMREQYGDEEGERRFYDNYRYANGRFAPKGRGTRRGYEEMMPFDYRTNIDGIYNNEHLRDMDRGMGRMYYTPAGRGMDEIQSRYDRAKRGYEERRTMHPGDMDEDREGMKRLEELLNVVGGDVKELMPKMSQSEKAMTAQKMETWARMLK